MNKFFTYILAFFLYFTFLNAEVVKELEINGNNRISKETIKVYGGIQNLNKNFTNQDLDEILKNLYGTIFLKT